MRRPSDRKPAMYELGEYYEISWYGNKNPKTYQFIQVTRCGFNFLDHNTHKCLFRQHFYIHKATGRFWVNRMMMTKKVEKSLV